MGGLFYVWGGPLRGEAKYGRVDFLPDAKCRARAIGAYRLTDSW
jgi:hypothetical protein